MSDTGGEDRRDTSGPGNGGPGDAFGEALRELGGTARASLGAATDSAKALRSLVSADIALARSALGRALGYTGVAIVFGASAWLLLMGTLVAFLVEIGLSWLLALLVAALLSLGVTAFACWRAMHYFDHTRLEATRRQLARLGIGELSELLPGAGSPESARDGAGRDENGERAP